MTTLLSWLVRSINSLEAPERHMGRQIARVVGGFADGLAEPFERLPANGDIVVIAARVADGVPDLVQTVRLLKSLLQVPPVDQFDGLPAVQVLPIGSVKRQQVADRCTVRKASAVVQRRRVGQIMEASAEP